MNDSQSVYSELDAYYASSVLSTDTVDTVKRPGTSSYAASTTALIPQESKNSAKVLKRGDESPEYYDFSLTDNPRHGQKDEPKGNFGWATLRLANPRFSPSAPAERKPQIPTYLTGEKISASVILGREKRPTITSIQLVVTGRVVPRLVKTWAKQRSYQILEERHILWPRAGEKGDLPTKSEEELHLEADFPAEVDLSSLYHPSTKKTQRSSSIHPTPPSIKDPIVTVEYRIALLIEHGRFRSPSIITTAISYVLKTTPPSAAGRRKQAYLEGRPTPSPLMDPEGWYTEGPLRLQEASFGDRRSNLDLTLFLSKPLFYTCGAAISCHLTIACDTEEANFEAFASPDAQNVSLFCRLRVLEEPGVSEAAPAPHLQTDSHPLQSGNISPEAHTGWQTAERELGKCLFWTEEERAVPATGVRVRQLGGEIHLNKTLVPSFNAGVLSVEYFIRVTPPRVQRTKAEGAASQHPKSSAAQAKIPLLSIPVQIGTMRPKGPRQVTFTKPSQSPPLSKEDVNANSWMWLYRGH